ncbi:DNA-binding FadR family transcriptional regulator [Nocardioides aromaticivorans]|uniref:DNA-binding FadR family transcriptional regulator n=2 Tax=Nocardioides aromaticivorans TaxID=200618 RepID=A0A7Z0CKS3_9ACTN|nr:DNA-binding FadR family transcriptional regulator [Nocardioides aromaticivorans]
MVHGGQLRPGDRLPAERRLSEMFAVSRSTLREALSRLRAEGYVEVRRGVEGGTFVTELAQPYARWLAQMADDGSLLREIIDVRTAVESHIAWLAAERRTAEDLQQLAEAIDVDGDRLTPRQFRESDSRFHGLLARAAGSPRLHRLMETARGELFTPASEPLILPGTIARSHEEHHGILAAVRAGDGNRAAQRMRDHLHATFDDVSSAIESAGHLSR